MQLTTSLPLENTCIKTVKPWLPKRVIVTADAYKEDFAQQMLRRIQSFNIPVEILKNNRIMGVKGATEKETYKLAKNTMAIAALISL